VADTLASGTGYTRTGLIAVNELRRFNSPLWNDKLLASTAISKLHPYETGAEALLRWYSILHTVNILLCVHWLCIVNLRA
jgi:hypothetical protein